MKKLQRSRWEAQHKMDAALAAVDVAVADIRIAAFASGVAAAADFVGQFNGTSDQTPYVLSDVIRAKFNLLRRILSRSRSATAAIVIGWEGNGLVILLKNPL